MRSLVAFGAGVDSTAMAYRILRDTEKDVVLTYYDESNRYEDPAWAKIADKERACARACAQWFADNVRPVTELRFSNTLRVTPEKPRFFRIRPGFTQFCSRYVDWGMDKMSSLATEAELIQADEVLTGMTTWDFETDWQDEHWIPCYEARTDIPLRFPFVTKQADGTWDGAGRFEVRSMIPDELFALTIQCHLEPPCGRCWRCNLTAYYDEHCAGRTIEEIRAVDDAIARKYFLGKHFNAGADPETYGVFDKYAL